MAKRTRSGLRRSLHDPDDAVPGGDERHKVGDGIDAIPLRRIAGDHPFQIGCALKGGLDFAKRRGAGGRQPVPQWRPKSTNAGACGKGVGRTKRHSGIIGHRRHLQTQPCRPSQHPLVIGFVKSLHKTHIGNRVEGCSSGQHKPVAPCASDAAIDDMGEGTANTIWVAAALSTRSCVWEWCWMPSTRRMASGCHICSVLNGGPKMLTSSGVYGLRSMSSRG